MTTQLPLAFKRESFYKQGTELKANGKPNIAASVMDEKLVDRREIHPKLKEKAGRLTGMAAKQAGWLHGHLKSMIEKLESFKQADMLRIENTETPKWTHAELDGKYKKIEMSAKMLVTLLEQATSFERMLPIYQSSEEKGNVGNRTQMREEIWDMGAGTEWMKWVRKELEDQSGKLFVRSEATAASRMAAGAKSIATGLCYYMDMTVQIEEKGAKGFLEYYKELQHKQSNAAQTLLKNSDLRNMASGMETMEAIGMYD